MPFSFFRPNLPNTALSDIPIVESDSSDNESPTIPMSSSRIIISLYGDHFAKTALLTPLGLSESSTALRIQGYYLLPTLLELPNHSILTRLSIYSLNNNTAIVTSAQRAVIDRTDALILTYLTDSESSINLLTNNMATWGHTAIPIVIIGLQRNGATNDYLIAGEKLAFDLQTTHFTASTNDIFPTTDLGLTKTLEKAIDLAKRNRRRAPIWLTSDTQRATTREVASTYDDTEDEDSSNYALESSDALTPGSS